MVDKLFLPGTFLKTYGCANCVWKSYGLCPQGYSGAEIYGVGSLVHPVGSDLPIGYCDDFAEFLFTLSDGNSSLANLKEKIHLYIQEMQSFKDHRKFLELREQYDKAKSEGYTDRDLKDLRQAIELYKTWWSRLTEQIVKGYQRAADRESRSKDIQGSSKISVQQLNVLLKESIPQLKDFKDSSKVGGGE